MERDNRERSPSGQGTALRPLTASLNLLGAWTVLNLLFNVRYPAPEPLGWYLLPSLDATVLLVITGLYVLRARRTSSVIVGAAAVLAVGVRLFRIGDGVTHRYFNRPLSLGLDLPLWSEPVQLLWATANHVLLVVAMLLAIGVLVGIGLLAARALRIAERALSVRAPRVLLVGICALAAAAALVAPGVRAPGHHGSVERIGGFAASVVPRLVAETTFLFGMGGYRAGQAAHIDATAATLRASPHGLERLHHANVLIFLIESYGAAVIDRPEIARRITPVYDGIDVALQRHGFLVASGLLDSPTYAGRSWLAQETLATAVRTPDRLVDDLVQRMRPASIAHFFHEAGYRTVLAQPANRYRSLSRWLYDFDAVYSGWDFDYRGPSYGWANMPDQYVIDFVGRREIQPARQPLLVTYALLSSHAPWNEQPPIVDDWSRLGNGAVYTTLPTGHFPITWITLTSAVEGYAHSVAYDLGVLADYVTRFVAGDTLVIVLGDHQPVAEVTDFSPSHAVPIHVISRSGELVAAFRARGYVAGMRPSTSGPHRGMETFLPDLLEDFSVRKNPVGEPGH